MRKAKQLSDQRQGRLFGRGAYGGIDFNPTVPDEDKPRLGRQHHELLERLSMGSATNVELSKIGLRFGARLHELREAGYNIVTEKQEGGLVIYKWVQQEAGDYPD